MFVVLTALWRGLNERLDVDCYFVYASCSIIILLWVHFCDAYRVKMANRVRQTRRCGVRLGDGRVAVEAKYGGFAGMSNTIHGLDCIGIPGSTYHLLNDDVSGHVVPDLTVRLHGIDTSKCGYYVKVSEVGNWKNSFSVCEWRLKAIK